MIWFCIICHKGDQLIGLYYVHMKKAQCNTVQPKS
jgi:aspartate 1-decarboxylase